MLAFVGCEWCYLSLKESWRRGSAVAGAAARAEEMSSTWLARACDPSIPVLCGRQAPGPCCEPPPCCLHGSTGRRLAVLCDPQVAGLRRARSCRFNAPEWSVCRRVAAVLQLACFAGSRGGAPGCIKQIDRRGRLGVLPAAAACRCLVRRYESSGCQRQQVVPGGRERVAPAPPQWTNRPSVPLA